VVAGLEGGVAVLAIALGQLRSSCSVSSCLRSASRTMFTIRYS
jgi:hypothetical protein